MHVKCPQLNDKGARPSSSLYISKQTGHLNDDLTKYQLIFKLIKSDHTYIFSLIIGMWSRRDERKLKYDSFTVFDFDEVTLLTLDDFN